MGTCSWLPGSVKLFFAGPNGFTQAEPTPALCSQMGRMLLRPDSTLPGSGIAHFPQEPPLRGRDDRISPFLWKGPEDRMEEVTVGHLTTSRGQRAHPSGTRISEQFSLGQGGQGQFPITQSPQASMMMLWPVYGPMLGRQDCLFDPSCGCTFLNGSLGARPVGLEYLSPTS